MNGIDYNKLSIEKFIERNKDKTAIEIYSECVREGNWAEGIKTKRTTVEDRDFGHKVQNYFMFLREAGHAFGGFSNKYDISNPEQCLRNIQKSYPY